MVNRHVVSASFTIDADISSFDEAAFRSSLAALHVGVLASDIELTISTGSIVVAARISSSSPDTARDLASTLQSSSSAVLSAQLNVAVQSVSAVATAVEIVVAPPPPLQGSTTMPDLITNNSANALTGGESGTASGVNDDLQSMLINVVIILGVLLAGAVATLMCVCYLRGRLFGSDAKMRRMPTVRRAPKPRMVKVHGVSKAPEGFGLDPEEIDNFNSSPNKTGETDMNDMEIDDSRL